MGVLRGLFSRAAATLLALLLVTPALAQTQIAPSERVKHGVVVRAAPSTGSSVIGALNPGEALGRVGDVQGWYRVLLPDGRDGFVSKAWTRLVTSQASASAADTYKLHMIDVGTGLALFIEGPAFTMIYDGGSQDDLGAGADNRIIAYLKAVRPNLKVIDHLILSHPHKDHVELLPDLFDAYSIRNVWDSGAVNPTLGYCRFLKKVATEPGVIYHDAISTGGFHEVLFTNKKCKGAVKIAQGEMMSASAVSLGGGARMVVLYRDASKHSDPNENSVVVRLDLGTRRILIAGDAEAGDRDLPSDPPLPGSIEGELLSCCKSDLTSDVLIVGHHGSRTSSRQLFLDGVGAKLFLVSSGPHPYQTVRLPDREVITELKSRGQVWETDLHDDRCGLDLPKIGDPADESPGGCDNVLVTINPTGQISIEYYQPPN